jgi:signal transduction histidine kinase
MRIPIPALVFAAFLTLAGAILAIGGLLARRQTVERLERDRAPHEQLAAELGAELRRLETRYEAHLRALLTRAETDTGANFVNACRNIKGVRHFSRLHPKPGNRDLQIEIRVPNRPDVPVPALKTSAGSSGVGRRELLPEQLFPNEGIMRGWLREPGRPSVFVGHYDGAALLLSIDEEEVLTAIDGWLRNWMSRSFAEIDAMNGEDRIAGPRKEALIGFTTPATPPDWLLPVGSQFGTWRIESWDARVLRQSWHVPTWIGAVALAVSAVGMGAWLALRVRRERRHAEQRVSFVNRVSHELRTPLTNILLNLDVASDQIAEEGPARRLSLVREEARRLGRLIENVLTFSRRERDQLDVRAHACAPAAVVDEVLEQFSPAFARRQITVRRHIEDAHTCLVDADALSQITANLLSNVEKYAPGRAVELRLRFEGERLMLTVADEGPGIPPHAAERIFRPFERLDSRVTEGVTGTGLGLAIARELAHRMGGTLELIPSVRGATFEFRAPAPAVPGLRATSAA